MFVCVCFGRTSHALFWRQNTEALETNVDQLMFFLGIFFGYGSIIFQNAPPPPLPLISPSPRHATRGLADFFRQLVRRTIQQVPKIYLEKKAKQTMLVLPHFCCTHLIRIAPTSFHPCRVCTFSLVCLCSCFCTALIFVAVVVYIVFFCFSLSVVVLRYFICIQYIFLVFLIFFLTFFRIPRCSPLVFFSSPYFFISWLGWALVWCYGG